MLLLCSWQRLHPLLVLHKNEEYIDCTIPLGSYVGAPQAVFSCRLPSCIPRANYNLPLITHWLTHSCIPHTYRVKRHFR